MNKNCGYDTWVISEGENLEEPIGIQIKRFKIGLEYCTPALFD